MSMPEQVKAVFDTLAEMKEKSSMTIHGIFVERFITGYSVEGGSLMRAVPAASTVVQLAKGKGTLLPDE